MKIAEPIKIGTMELKNRMYAAPMVTLYADENGNVTPKLCDIYRQKAKGGWGLVCVEATNVLFSGRNFTRMLGIYDDRQVTGLSELADAIRDGGTKSCIQLQHAGRQTDQRFNGGAPKLAPSPISPWPPGSDNPTEMTLDDCENVAEAFVQAARRAKEAGFDSVQLHATHGFLLQEFMSPYTNQRSDKYGDPCAFVCEVTRKVKDQVGRDFPVGIRIAADEYLGDKGITIDTFVSKFVTPLEEAGIDWFDVSAGMFETLVHWIQPIYFNKAYLVPLAAKIKQVAAVPVSGIGKINEPDLAKRLIEDEEVDIVGFSRQSLADHNFPNKLLSGQDDEINRCICCDIGCTDRLLNQFGVSCAIHFEFGKDPSVKEITPAADPKKVMVVGGGVAGMEAAKILAKRGHKVTLFEKETALGGTVGLASTLPKLATGELARITKLQKHQLEQTGVEIHLSTAVTPEKVRQFAPDAVIVATGGRPVMPDIPGINGKNVIVSDEFLKNRINNAENVIVLGGNYGAEIAVSLARLGKKVTMVEESANTATTPFIYLGRMLVLQSYLEADKVEVLTETKINEITDTGVKVTGKDGTEKTIAGDVVVIALGREADTELADAIEGMVPEMYRIGDCTEPHSIYRAIHQASITAREV